jgi:hypothetical protein
MIKKKTIKIHLLTSTGPFKTTKSYKNKRKRFKIKILFYNCNKQRKQRRREKKIRKMKI